MEIIEYGSPSAEVVLVQMVGDHDVGMVEKEVEGIQSNTGKAFRMIAVKVDDWNTDLSPWEAPAVFGDRGFAGGAPAVLARVLELCSDKSRKYFIGGYSLSGLFALWAAYQTDTFQGVAAASPSIWFPDFVEYMQLRKIQSRFVYLSLGDKEAKTRNRVMAAVGDKIIEAYDHLKTEQVECVLEWNQGNHFRDADLRVIKAFSKVLKMYQE